MRVTGIEDEDGSKSAGDDIDCVTECTQILPGYMNCSNRYQRRSPCLAHFWPLDGRNVCKRLVTTVVTPSSKLGICASPQH